MKKLFVALLFVSGFALNFTANAAVPSALLKQDPPTLAPMLEKVMPAVVNIVATGEVQMAGNPLLDDPFFRHFFDMPRQPRRRLKRSVGSGVIVYAKNGIVLTNAHVVANADSI
ncbi:MAG: serine endoprotease DegQ, partial [Salinisphaeraceae bacterium]|nr:serine endoprotease DegQ [Salinisphaeraceae bacterium]